MNTKDDKNPELSEEEIEDIQFYLEEGEKLINDLERSFNTFLLNPDDLENLKVAYRMAHTIKGNSGFLELDDLVEIAHRMEEIFNSLLKDELTFHESIKTVLNKGMRVIRELFSQLGATYEANLKDRTLIDDLKEILTKREDSLEEGEKKKSEIADSPRPVPQFANVENYLLAQVGDRIFGINRNFISETRPKLSVSTIPLCDLFLNQIGNLNGDLVPVINVKRLFHLEEEVTSESSIYVVINALTGSYCFKFDKIAGFLSAEKKDITPTSPDKYMNQTYFSMGLTAKEEQPVDIIDIRKIILFINSSNRSMV